MHLRASIKEDNAYNMFDVRELIMTGVPNSRTDCRTEVGNAKLVLNRGAIIGLVFGHLDEA